MFSDDMVRIAPTPVTGVGNVLDTKYPSADGRVVSRSYDASERLDRVWDTKGLIADYAYDGRLVGRKELGGSLPSPPESGATSPAVKTTVSYDGMQRPESILHESSSGSSLFAGLTTRFDAVGNRLAQKLEGLGSTDAHSQLYTLDALYRTTSWKRGPLNANLDAIANPVEEASWPEIDGQNDWISWETPTFGSCARYTNQSMAPFVRQVEDSCWKGIPYEPTTTTYAFDEDGNLVSDGAYEYSWDFLNRLIRVDEAGTGELVVAYGYDAFNRRVVKVFPGNVPSPDPDLLCVYGLATNIRRAVNCPYGLRPRS